MEGANPQLRSHSMTSLTHGFGKPRLQRLVDKSGLVRKLLIGKRKDSDRSTFESHIWWIRKQKAGVETC